MRNEVLSVELKAFNFRAEMPVFDISCFIIRFQLQMALKNCNRVKKLHNLHNVLTSVYSETKRLMISTRYVLLYTFSSYVHIKLFIFPRPDSAILWKLSKDGSRPRAGPPRVKGLSSKILSLPNRSLSGCRTRGE